MRTFFAVTWEDSIALGKHKTRSEAEDYAIDQFNIHQAEPGYLILDRSELQELVHHGLYAVSHQTIPEGA